MEMLILEIMARKTIEQKLITMAVVGAHITLWWWLGIRILSRNNL